MTPANPIHCDLVTLDPLMGDACHILSILATWKGSLCGLTALRRPSWGMIGEASMGSLGPRVAEFFFEAAI
jgi:hypothetical protein